MTEKSQSKSHEVEKAITDFKSYAESVGPQGLSYIVNTQVHLARRIFWTMVFILGSGFSLSKIALLLIILKKTNKC